MTREVDSTQLPVVASCSLDADGLRRQRERYRRAGEGAKVAEKDTRRLVVEVEPGSEETVAELVAVERECCPFFGLDWDAGRRRLSVSVAEREHEPALEAIAYALGL